MIAIGLLPGSAGNRELGEFFCGDLGNVVERTFDGGQALVDPDGDVQAGKFDLVPFAAWVNADDVGARALRQGGDDVVGQSRAEAGVHAFRLGNGLGIVTGCHCLAEGGEPVDQGAEVLAAPDGAVAGVVIGRVVVGVVRVSLSLPVSVSFVSVIPVSVRSPSVSSPSVSSPSVSSPSVSSPSV